MNGAKLRNFLRCICKSEETSTAYVETTEIIRAENYYGRVNATVVEDTRNMTMTRLSAGLWEVVLTPPHPDGLEYHVGLTSTEEGQLRDGADVQVVKGTKTPNGFRVMITEGDNSTVADVLVDQSFTVSINAPVEVLVPNTP